MIFFTSRACKFYHNSTGSHSYSLCLVRAPKAAKVHFTYLLQFARCTNELDEREKELFSSKIVHHQYFFFSLFFAKFLRRPKVVQRGMRNVPQLLVCMHVALQHNTKKTLSIIIMMPSTYELCIHIMDRQKNETNFQLRDMFLLRSPVTPRKKSKR